jgi:peptidoglycan/LPS O-acetylase OafA/YrhL
MVDSRLAVTTDLGYRPELDGLRALAIAGVVAAHVGIGWAVGAATGVYFFFVLSGFLITRLLLDERAATGRVDLPAFWRRRVARLAPGLISLAAATALWAWLEGEDRTLDMVPSVLGYMSNWYMQVAGREDFLGHTWSLAVEEQFYLVWPIAFALVAWRMNAWWLAGAAIVASTFARWSLWGADGPVQWRTDFVADLLLVGCAAALLSYRRPIAIPRWLLGAGVATIASRVVLRGADLAGDWLTVWGVGPFAMASAVVILWAVDRRPRWLCWRPLVAVGRASYSLYLWHVLVFAIGTRAGWGLLPKLAAAGIVSTASYRFIEQPARRWLNSRWRNDSDPHRADGVVAGVEGDDVLVVAVPR